MKEPEILQTQIDRTVTFIHNASIFCKYHGPTNRRGARIGVQRRGDKGEKATYYPYCHDLDLYENFEQRARNFADKIGWGGNLIGSMACEGAVFLILDFKGVPRNATK